MGHDLGCGHFVIDSHHSLSSGSLSDLIRMEAYSWMELPKLYPFVQIWSFFLALNSQDCDGAMPDFHLKDSSLTFLVMVKIINTHPLFIQQHQQAQDQNRRSDQWEGSGIVFFRFSEIGRWHL